VFIVCDIAATIVRIAGAVLVDVAYPNQDDLATPNKTLLAGLAFQVFSFAVVKARKSPASASRSFIAALVVATSVWQRQQRA
jgi:hypothetical protein